MSLPIGTWKAVVNGLETALRIDAADRKRLRRSAKAVAQWCQQHRHDPVENQAAALNAKLRGHYQYYGRPTNYRSLWRY